MNASPVITLTNGIRVANFSSNHTFAFTDGSILPACDDERCSLLSGKTKEVEKPRIKVEYRGGQRLELAWTDIVISFELTEGLMEALDELDTRDDIDIIIVPLPILGAARSWLEANTSRRWIKLRTGRLADRVKKIHHIDRFCV